MEKPKFYDEAQVLGEFTPINLGGHKLVIMQVEEVTASNGKQYLKISFDTAKDDVQPNYYSNAYKQDNRDNKKWSGTTTVFPTDYEGKTSKQFKTFCTSVEKSNAGFKIVWGDQFCNALKGKAIGGVFGEEEYLNNMNEVKTARKLFWFRSIDKVVDAEVPAKRELSDNDVDKAVGTAISNGFINIPDGIDELPFN
jgi:hypothetical protein